MRGSRYSAPLNVAQGVARMAWWVGRAASASAGSLMFGCRTSRRMVISASSPLSSLGDSLSSWMALTARTVPLVRCTARNTWANEPAPSLATMSYSPRGMGPRGSAMVGRETHTAAASQRRPLAHDGAEGAGAASVCVRQQPRFVPCESELGGRVGE